MTNASLIQSIDLLWKSIDWFLHEGDIGRQRVNSLATNISII